MELEQKSVETNVGEIVYFVGPRFENRPWVVFFHGLSSNHTTWERAIESLSKLKYNTLAMDLRGHGYSDKTKRKKLYTFDQFAEDTNTILDKESISKAIFVGYSFGGSLALDFALRYPKKIHGLFLMSTNYVNPWVYKGINFLTPFGAAFLKTLAFLLRWQNWKVYHYYRYDPSNRNGYWKSTIRGWQTMPLSVNLWMLLLYGELDLRKKAFPLGIPIKLVVAKNDPFVGEKETLDMARVLGAEAKISEFASHFLASQAQSEMNALLIEFIKEKCE